MHSLMRMDAKNNHISETVCVSLMVLTLCCLDGLHCTALHCTALHCTTALTVVEEARTNSAAGARVVRCCKRYVPGCWGSWGSISRRHDVDAQVSERSTSTECWLQPRYSHATATLQETDRPASPSNCLESIYQQG